MDIGNIILILYGAAVALYIIIIETTKVKGRRLVNEPFAFIIGIFAGAYLLHAYHERQSAFWGGIITCIWILYSIFKNRSRTA